jgi:predicted acylesterase/phospholipase RssA
MATKKALVLSGGGGRGAYHIGVIEALIEQGWIEDGKGPDIIAGTSIGAINAAALASGMTIAQLKRHWLAMHTEDVHCLSNDLPVVTRPLLRFLLRSVLTSDAHGGARFQFPTEEANMSTQGVLSVARHARAVDGFRANQQPGCSGAVTGRYRVAERRATGVLQSRTRWPPGR